MPLPRRSRPFGDLEATVMDLMWSADRPLLVREVVDLMRPERAPAYTTVMTVMDNLHRKGWLERAAGRPGLALRAGAHPAGLHRPAHARGACGQRRPGRRAGALRRGDRPRGRRRARRRPGGGAAQDGPGRGAR